MHPFFQSDSISLKVCGVTLESDADQLVELGVEAIGVNFWENSKRYCSPEDATFLKKIAGQILRVGVFVNANPELVNQLLDEGYIDYAQFHGDEDKGYLKPFIESNKPFLRAVGIENEASIENLYLDGCSAILLDAHAPGVYGGTGKTCDWSIIEKVNNRYPELPIILAGGITPENVEEARQLSHISGLDVASGAESAPGIKDFDKVKQLMG